MGATKTTAPRNAAGLTPVQVRFAVAGIFVASFVSTIDATIVATSLQTITGELGRPDQGPLIVLAYLLAATAATPFWGRFGDVHGRKQTAQLLVIVFSIASLGIAIAQSMNQLLAARLVQGIAGGGILAVTRALIGDIATPRERGKYQWMTSGVWIAATALGPVVGGFFVEHSSWRWSFAVNVPLGLFAMLVLQIGVPRTPTNPERSLDLPGILLLSGFVSGVSLALLTWGGEAYRWGDSAIAAIIAASIAFLVAFVIWERREPQPLVPREHIRDRTIVLSNIITFLSAVLTYQITIFAPLFVQVVKADGATKSGLLVMPLLVGNFAAAMIGGRVITRTGHYRGVVLVGTAMCFVGTLLLATIDGGSSRTDLSIAIFVIGAGNGLVGPTMMLVNQNAVAQRDLGVASSINTLCRSLGNVISVGVVGAVFARELTARLRAADLAELNPDTLRARPRDIVALAPRERSIVVDAFDGAINLGFRTVVVSGAAVLIASLFLRQVKLRDTM